MARILDLTPILPSQSSLRITIEGGRKVIYIPRRKFEALRAELNADKLYVAYEDERSVVIVGFNGDPNKPRMMKVPRAVLYGDVKSLVSRVLGF